MTSSDPQQPGTGDNDPTVIAPQADANPPYSLSKSPDGDAEAPTTAYSTPSNPYSVPADPYAMPADPYAAPADPYAAQNPYAASDPYAAQPNPYAAPADPYAQPDPYAAQNPYGTQPPQYGGVPPQYPSYPGANGGPGIGYPAYGQPAQSGTNGLAIASMICGIISFPLGCAWGAGVIFAIAGLITGIIAMKQVKQTGQDGSGMALTGVILSSVYIFLFVIAIVIFIAIGVSGGFDTSSSDYLLSLVR